jgi:single-stranded DNA-binding protein
MGQDDEKPKIEIEGRVKATPEMKRLEGGKLVAHLEVVASKVMIDGREESADAHKWQRISLWGLDAKRAAERFPRGTRVAVKGDREVKTWESKTGPRQSEEIRDARIEVLEKAKNEPGERVELTGTLAFRPELQQTPKGLDYVRLAVEVDGGRRENVVLWGEKAEEAADRLDKGARIHVEGERVDRSYDRKGDDGEKERVEYFEIQKAKVNELAQEKKASGRSEPQREGGVGQRLREAFGLSR